MHRGLHIHTHTRECVGVAKKREGDAFIITRVGISRGRILFNPTRTVRAQHDASPPSVMLHSAPRRRLRLLGCPTRQHRRCGGCRGDSVAALRHHHRSTCARRSKCVFRCPSGRGAKDMVKVEESSEQIPPIFCRKSGTRGGLASVTPSQTTKKTEKVANCRSHLQEAQAREKTEPVRQRRGISRAAASFSRHSTLWRRSKGLRDSIVRRL